MYKKDARKIFDEFYKNFNTRRLKTIEFLVKENTDQSIIIFEISQWPEEKKSNLYGYSFLVLDENHNITYDEADGEMEINKIRKIYNDINCIKYYKTVE